MKISWKIKMLLALVNVFFNIIMLISSFLSNNQIILSWSIGYASFSVYYLNQQIKELRKVVEHGRVVIRNA